MDLLRWEGSPQATFSLGFLSPRADRFSRYARSFGHLGGVLNEPPSRASAPQGQQAGARRATI